jgi:hypothetical protein
MIHPRRKAHFLRPNPRLIRCLVLRNFCHDAWVLLAFGISQGKNLQKENSELERGKSPLFPLHLQVRFRTPRCLYLGEKGGGSDMTLYEDGWHTSIEAEQNISKKTIKFRKEIEFVSYFCQPRDDDDGCGGSLLVIPYSHRF